MFDLTRINPGDIERELSRMSVNNIIKATAAGEFPAVLSLLGYNPLRRASMISAMYGEMGVNSGDYPFFKPTDEKTLEATRRGSNTLADIINTTVKRKYADVGRMLSYYETKFAPMLGAHGETYMICVSTQMDLYRALVAVQAQLGETLDIPVLPKSTKVADDDPRRGSHLIEGTQAYDLYMHLKDGKSRHTELEKLLSEEVIDAVIVVSPRSNAKIQIYRRKSPSSIAEKVAYSDNGYIINMAYGTLFPRKQKPNTRIRKYHTHTETGAKDTAGVGFILMNSNLDVGFVPGVIAGSDLSSLVSVRDIDPIPSTGELHFDMRFVRESQALESFIYCGRTEAHVFNTVNHYLTSQLVGPYARGPFKQSRLRELNEWQPIKNKAVDFGYDHLRANVLTAMRGIALPSFPGACFVINDYKMELPPLGKNGLILVKDYGLLEGSSNSLVNVFSLTG
jgi:hypothetical protein